MSNLQIAPELDLGALPRLNIGRSYGAGSSRLNQSFVWLDVFDRPRDKRILTACCKVDDSEIFTVGQSERSDATRPRVWPAAPLRPSGGDRNAQHTRDR